MIAVACLASALVLAADEPAAEPDLDSLLEETAETKKQEEPPATADLPAIGDEDQLAIFTLERGFYVASGLGTFFSFGGVRGYSDAQPFLAVKAGFDLGNYLSVQAAVSSGYVSGNAISGYDVPEGEKGAVPSPLRLNVNNYSVLNIGAELVGALRPTARVAVELLGGAGVSYFVPQPTNPDDPTAPLDTISPHVAVGLELKYLTLLTDFTAGLAGTAYYLTAPRVLTLGAAVVVRYTF